MTTAPAAVEAQQLVKTYAGDVRAVKGISFTVAAGEAFGLLGPNGAGKTTTVGMLNSTVAPTSGRALLGGLDVAEDPIGTRAMSSVVFQDAVGPFGRVHVHASRPGGVAARSLYIFSRYAGRRLDTPPSPSKQRIRSGAIMAHPAPAAGRPPGAGRPERKNSMPQVQTVRGPVDTSELGRTFMHEHIFVLTPEVQQNYPGEWGDEDDRVKDAVGKLQALADQGIRTIVDPTVVGLGRYIPRIQRIAAQVPSLHIVVATGCYTYDDVPFFFHYRGPALSAVVGVDVPDPMVDMFATDIHEGIAGTGVKAAFLKCAIDHKGMTSGVARVMRTVAKTHRQTGAPITVHTHPVSQTGLDVKRLLCDEEGVDPTRVVLGHSGDTADVGHLTELAEQGFILGMDRFGINVETTFEARADTLVEMCRRGFAEQMVLSQDASCYIDWIDPMVLASLSQWHYLHIVNDVLPYVRDHGVTDDQIDAMLIRTPRRYFENTSPY